MDFLVGQACMQHQGECDDGGMLGDEGRNCKCVRACVQARCAILAHTHAIGSIMRSMALHWCLELLVSCTRWMCSCRGGVCTLVLACACVRLQLQCIRAVLTAANLFSFCSFTCGWFLGLSGTLLSGQRPAWRRGVCRGRDTEGQKFTVPQFEATGTWR
eukprot:1159946-Pelagomonas_calceolata.AAC.11